MGYEGRSAEFYVGYVPSWRSLIIRDLQMMPNTKLVLLVISEFMSGMGRMQWPSKDELVDLTGLKKAQIETALKYARDHGYLQFRRDMRSGDCEYEVRVPANPPVADLWTPAHPGKSAPVFAIPGKDILAEVLDAVACHALIDALAESRKTDGIAQQARDSGLWDPEEATSEEVEGAVPPPPGDPAPRVGKQPGTPRRWS